MSGGGTLIEAYAVDAVISAIENPQYGVATALRASNAAAMEEALKQTAVLMNAAVSAAALGMAPGVTGINWKLNAERSESICKIVRMNYLSWLTTQIMEGAADLKRIPSEPSRNTKDR